MLKKIEKPLLAWYDNGHRDLPWRQNKDAYRIWVSEIMLQQTRVETVIPYYLRFLETFPNIATLAAAPEDKLLKCWEGLGYYSRVRNMQKAAITVMEEYHGQMPIHGKLCRNYQALAVIRLVRLHPLHLEDRFRQWMGMYCVCSAGCAWTENILRFLL